jgi:hypothetical protein
LTVFIAPAKVYDQPKSKRMAGRSNPYENRVTPSETAAPSAKTMAKVMLCCKVGGAFWESDIALLCWIKR